MSLELSWLTESYDGHSDPQKASSESARRAREREQERKRARGEASCAECRRLKIKCDKKIPCSSCTRRGCQSICPNGVLATGQGTRLVLANTEKLYNKLFQMSQRIRQLEDAVQILQSNVSNKAHPLLTEELLSIKSVAEILVNKTEEATETTEEDEALTTAMGTLTVSENGPTRFVGRIGAETLLMNETDDDTTDDASSSADTDSDTERELPEGLVLASKGFPFSQTYLPKKQLTALIREYLPPYDRAIALAEAYLGNIAWAPQAIKRDQVMEDLLPFVYGRKSGSTPMQAGSEEHKVTHKMHYLSLAMAIFACGAAADYTLPPNNREGRLYHTLALAALSRHPITASRGVSLETVQAILAFSQYDPTRGSSSLESHSRIVSIALSMAATIGLHRDPAHWNIEQKYEQRWRHAFWELFCMDQFKSLGSGRPSTFLLQAIDCEFPEDDDAFIDEEGKHVEGCNRWRYRFAKEVIGPLAEHLCLTRPVKYSELLDFDRKIREFPDPRLLPDSGPIGNVKDRLWSTQKDIVLLSLHRNFFAKAMINPDVDPLHSPFAPSYLTAYVCSVRLLRTVRECFDLNPASVLRVWPIWTDSLLSGAIVGCFILRTDQPAWATGAFRDLNIAISLFEEATAHFVARRGLPILLRVRERAETALKNLLNKAGSPFGTSVPETKRIDSEVLDILRDTARLVRRVNKANRGRSSAGGSPMSSDFGVGYSPGRSDTSSSAPTFPATVATHPSGAPAPMPAVSFDEMPFAYPDDETSINLGSNVLPSDPDPTWSSVQSSSGIDQDIASIFNAIYSRPSDGYNLGESSAPLNFGPQPCGQLPPLPAQPYRQRSCHPENSQASRHVSDGPSIVASNHSAASEQMPIDFAFSNHHTRNETPSPFSMSTPTFDFSWLEGSGPSNINKNAAEFANDWRFHGAT